MFARAEFEAKAGALGEVLYGGVHALLGVVGVGIVGWVLELVGFSLVTGMTARWLGVRTRSAAKVVKTTAERTALVNRRSDEEFDFDPVDWPAHSPRELRAGDGTSGAAGAQARAGAEFGGPFAASAQIGPVDLVGDMRRAAYGDACIERARRLR